MTSDERFLVTGSMGCLGAWTIRQLLDEGVGIVAFDLSSDRRRLELLATPAELERVDFVQGDIVQPGSIGDTIRSHGVTHVIHCAALQVPFVRANPPLGANVNVTGTVNVFEGVLATRDQVRGLVYASSAGVFGLPDLYADGVARDDSPQAPATLYGVFKQANEGTARIYAAEHGLWSVGLRPWVIYGLGRDQGMTSGVTVAMLAAAAGMPYRITYGGESLFQYAADVAARFIAAARAGLTGAAVFNVGGTTASVDEVIEAIERAAPDMAGAITHDPAPLAVVARADSSALERSVSVPPYVSLAEGVERTVRAFRRLVEEGRIAPPV